MNYENEHDWSEYKRLVLSELERLNQAVEKLKDQCVEIQSNIASELSKTSDKINDKISLMDKEYPSLVDLNDLREEINKIEKRFHFYKKEQQVDATITSKWGLWAAVITIIGSLIASGISLVIALSD